MPSCDIRHEREFCSRPPDRIGVVPAPRRYPDERGTPATGEGINISLERDATPPCQPMCGAFARAPSMAAMWLTSPALLQSQARADRLHLYPRRFRHRRNHRRCQIRRRARHGLRRVHRRFRLRRCRAAFSTFAAAALAAALVIAPDATAFFAPAVCCRRHILRVRCRRLARVRPTRPRPLVLARDVDSEIDSCRGTGHGSLWYTDRTIVSLVFTMDGAFVESLFCVFEWRCRTVPRTRGPGRRRRESDGPIGRGRDPG